MQLAIPKLQLPGKLHISTRTHGYLDYGLSLLLMASPALFGFGNAGLETIIPLVCAVIIFLYSFLTDYEVGLYASIPLKTHLGLDLFMSAFLVFSPFILDYDEITFLPQLFIGLAYALIVWMTFPIPVQVEKEMNSHQRKAA